jgi:regulator of replication initiation timing
MPFPKGNQRKGDKAKQPRPGIALDKSIIIDCIRAFNGNLSRVADHMGTTRQSIYQRIESDPELQTEIKQARERQIDRLENVVFQRAEESNDTTLQLFILKTQGRHRGWEQDEAKNTAKDIATAAFDFIINKSKPSQ